MTHNDINDLDIIEYVFEINGKKKGIEAHYDKNIDALVFPKSPFEYIVKLLGGEIIDTTE